MRGRDQILNRIFLSGLILLILNDAFLKWHFHNGITGKLSDFAGLLIFPIFISYLFPKTKNSSCLLTGVLFVFWKSSFSTPCIELFNSISLIKIHRVIDFTDLIALAVLPFSHRLLNREGGSDKTLSALLTGVRAGVLVITCLAFLATSMHRSEMPNGTVYLGDSHKVKLSKDSILSKLSSLGYKWHLVEESISVRPGYYHESYYRIDTIYIQDERRVDTISNVKFNIEEINPHKSRIELINVELSKEGNIQNWKYLKRLHKYYKKQIKDHLIEDVKSK